MLHTQKGLELFGGVEDFLLRHPLKVLAQRTDIVTLLLDLCGQRVALVSQAVAQFLERCGC
jgi:hypothetical protein